MPAAARYLLFVLVYAVAWSSLASDAVTRSKAIAIATDYVRNFPSLDITSLKISAERRAEPPDDALPSMRSRLAHRSFWLVSFTPRKLQLGGAYAVYVAANSGEILGSRGYK
jgi:hypothetical protein